MKNDHNATKPDFKEAIKRLWHQIGNTPFVTINYQYHNGPEQTIIAKCEYLNLSGHADDRLALYAFEKAYEQGKLRKGDLVVTGSANDLARSCAIIARALGHQVEPILAGSARHQHAFQPLAFAEQYRSEVHERTTGKEIGYYLLLKRVRPDAFVGHNGHVAGACKYLNTLFPAMVVNPTLINSNNKDALSVAQQLGAKLGLPVGTGSGANLLEAIRLQQQLGDQSVVMTVFPDDYRKLENMTYEPKEGHLTPDIRFIKAEVTDRDQHVIY